MKAIHRLAAPRGATTAESAPQGPSTCTVWCCYVEFLFSLLLFRGTRCERGRMFVTVICMLWNVVLLHAQPSSFRRTGVPGCTCGASLDNRRNRLPPPTAATDRCHRQLPTTVATDSNTDATSTFTDSDTRRHEPSSARRTPTSPPGGSSTCPGTGEGTAAASHPARRSAAPASAAAAPPAGSGATPSAKRGWRGPARSPG